MELRKYSGAWMTDIDDTIIESGEMPGNEWINWLTQKIRILKKFNIAWIPMSGVALVKLGPRILYRLPEDILSHVLYYGGDGSQKYYYSSTDSCWKEEDGFKTIFSDAQAIAVIGYNEYKKALEGICKDSPNPEVIVEKHLENGLSTLKKNNILADVAILDELKSVLKKNSYDPELSETYFRGGSVSWMMLGDISADPYREQKAIELRKELINLALRKLREKGGLKNLGQTSISIPFPGARGIKFVLEGNNKEKATRDLIKTQGVSADSIVFAGNEIFDGGNDNMIRNIDGITLISVGEHTDPGENIVFGGVGVDANNNWINNACNLLDNGLEWREILEDIKKSVIR